MLQKKSKKKRLLMFLIANATAEIRNIYVPQNLDGSFKGKVTNNHLIVL